MTWKLRVRALPQEGDASFTITSKFMAWEGIEVRQPTAWVRVASNGLNLTQEKFQFMSKHTNGEWEFAVWLDGDASYTVTSNGMEVVTSKELVVTSKDGVVHFK